MALESVYKIGGYVLKSLNSADISGFAASALLLASLKADWFHEIIDGWSRTFLIWAHILAIVIPLIYKIRKFRKGERNSRGNKEIQ